MSIDWLSWIECVAIPVIVGTPIAAFIFWQGEKLQSAHERLERTCQEMRRAHDRLTHMASHDQMTDLLNREGFMREAAPFHTGASGHYLLIVDADHFKRINDLHGHQKGDEALMKIARALRYATRGKDIVGRIGGEEFAILLISVGAQEAERMAELIRRQVQEIPWLSDDLSGQGLTVSIGGAAVQRTAGRFADTLREADRCLYEAKRLGRNRVIFDHMTTATTAAA